MNVSNLIIMFRAVYYLLCLNRSKAISTPDVNISTDDGVHDVIYGITVSAINNPTFCYYLYFMYSPTFCYYLYFMSSLRT
jgi:hypothetical protein